MLRGADSASLRAGETFNPVSPRRSGPTPGVAAGTGSAARKVRPNVRQLRHQAIAALPRPAAAVAGGGGARSRREVVGTEAIAKLLE